MLHDTITPEVAKTLGEQQLFIEFLKTKLTQALNRMKLYADQKRSDKVFQVNDFVLLKLQPYSQSSLVNRSCPKLAMKYYGPYKVIEKVGAVAYKLELPTDCQVYLVFHVSELNEFSTYHTSSLQESSSTTSFGCCTAAAWGQSASQGGGTVTPDGGNNVTSNSTGPEMGEH